MISNEHSTRILTINTGSSSLKFALSESVQPERFMLTGRLDRIGLGTGTFHAEHADGATLIERTLALPDHDSAIETLVSWLRGQPVAERLQAIGHRVVHGGAKYAEPQVITTELIASLRELIPLAPDHLPQEIKIIEAMRGAYPSVPQVACFDTAFHRCMPPVAQTYALPRRFHTEGVLRYGFHGLSCEYIVDELRNVAPETADGRVIIAHLGHGASMTAVAQGRSIDTTMGFTPAGGLVMSTRSGDLDPGVILYLLGRNGLSLSDANDLLNHQAGLLGLSDSTSDIKDLLDKEKTDPRADTAVELFCYQAKKYLASLSAVLGGLDVLVFTAGIGENAPSIRWRICKDLAYLGIQLDEAYNDANAAVISAAPASVTVRVMKTNEELMIARHTLCLLRRGSTQT